MNIFPSLEEQDQEESLRIMILLEDNIDVWKLDEEHQRKKAEHFEFSIKNATLIAQGFELEEENFFEDSIISFDLLWPY